MKAELVGVDSPSWTDALSRVRHDAHQLPAYAAFAARHQHPGEPVALIASDGDHRLLVPLILRGLPAALGAPSAMRDAISPRGYPGAVAGPMDGGRDAFVQRAVAALPQALRAAGVVTAFVRLSPLSRIPLATLRGIGEVVEHGTSVSIDLGLSAEELWHQTRSNHRRHIHRARRSGYVARADDDWSALDDFLTAYAESMDRLGSAASWRLPRSYFEEFRDALDGRLHLCVVERDGELAAGCMVTEEDGVVDYSFAGTRDAHVRESPSKLLIDFVGSWAKERGNRIFHLGGSLSPGDPLNHFKLGFSPVEHVVASWRVVADPGAEASLTDAWRALAGHAADPDDASFPAYRRGIA